MSTGDYQEQLDRQEEAQRRGSEREAALGQASEQARMDPAAQVPNRSFFREYGDADISPRPGAGGLEQRVAPELSHHHLFGNITPEERERLQLLNQPLAMQVKAEHPRPSGVSSKCVGKYRREMFGDSEEGEKAVLTDSMAREIDSTLGEEGVRSQMQSQAVQASAWKGITQIQSVAYTSAKEGAEKASGVIGNAKDLLFGGD